MITREFNLYLHAGHSIPLVINANQYDRGEQWLFKLFNSDGTQYVPSSGAIVGIKSDNLGIINSGTVDSQGRVVINETQQMTAAVGKAVFELVIDDGTHGTANFVVLVEPKPGDNADLSETDISMIEQAVEAASTIKPYGSPLVASTVAGMTDHEKVYVYVGSETGYTSGNWYYWDGTAWTSGGVYNSVAVQTDTTLTLSGVAADAKKTGDEISDLKSQISTFEAIPRSVKLAMDNLFAKSAYAVEDVSSDYAIFHAWANAINLLSISAIYTQSGDVYTVDSLESLKSDLVVTANYDNGTSAEVSGYTLSGTLTEGTSPITVTYEGKTASFNVTVKGGALYRLRNTTFDGTNSVDTGLKPFETDSDWSIAVDLQNTITSSDAIFRLFGALNGVSPWAGVSVQRRAASGANATKWKIQWMTQVYYIASPSILSNFALKLVLTHTNGSNVMNIKYVVDSGSAVTQTLTDTFQSVTENLTIGYAAGDLWEGVINDFILYNHVLTSEEINSFLGV